MNDIKTSYVSLARWSAVIKGVTITHEPGEIGNLSTFVDGDGKPVFHMTLNQWHMEKDGIFTWHESGEVGDYSGILDENGNSVVPGLIEARAVQVIVQAIAPEAAIEAMPQLPLVAPVMPLVSGKKSSRVDFPTITPVTDTPTQEELKADVEYLNSQSEV